MITLALDASTYTGDVAVLDDDRVLAEESVLMKGADEERLMPAVARCLDRAGVQPRDLGRVVCGEGPGSFTSLRIAGSIAKGIALAATCPLFAAPSMGMALGGAGLEAGRYLVAVDALRTEYYIGLYEQLDDGGVDELAPPRVVAVTDVPTAAAAEHAALVSPSEGVGIRTLPRARGVQALTRLLARRGPVALRAWEPAYGRLAEAQVKWERANGRPLPL